MEMDALDVKVEDTSHVTLSLITVGCHGECSDVQAVATGGYPPYSFVWEDGSTAAMRKLCPTDNTTYSVTATDFGITNVEFAQAPESVSAEVKTQLADCSSSALCIDNPSLEGAVGFQTWSADDPTAVASAWLPCTLTDGAFSPVFLNDTLGTTPPPWDLFFGRGRTPPKPTHGDAYLSLQTGNAASQPLCAPLVAGKTYSVKFDLLAWWDDVPVQLELKASSSACSDEAKTLWTSPSSGGIEWKTHCATFTADRDYPYLTLQVVSDDSGNPNQALVDNMVPVPRCDGVSQAP